MFSAGRQVAANSQGVQFYCGYSHLHSLNNVRYGMQSAHLGVMVCPRQVTSDVEGASVSFSSRAEYLPRQKAAS
jgi:hypothetical protein